MKLDRGILIAVEGIDCSGKSTAIKKLIDMFEKDGTNIVLTNEPGGTPLGEKIKNVLNETDIKVDVLAEFLLFSSARAQHFSKLVIPSLNDGKMVISDRMADSSTAFQGYGRGLDLSIIKTINKWTTQGYNPDITIYISIDKKTAMDRMEKRGDMTKLEEKFDSDKVASGFEKIFEGRKNFKKIDGKQNSESISKEAYEFIKQYITEKRKLKTNDEQNK